MAMFERGKTYKRAYISERLGGGVQDYLPHVGGRITYGAFSLDLNPQAPAVVLPGDGPEIMKWARVFADQQQAIPVFIKKRSNEWTYMGEYRCAELIEDVEVIAVHAHKTGRDDISMVLKLRRERDSHDQHSMSNG
ncbi:MAG: DUF6697 family protein [Gemmatimonadaceae bacterium]